MPSSLPNLSLDTSNPQQKEEAARRWCCHGHGMIVDVLPMMMIIIDLDNMQYQGDAAIYPYKIDACIENKAHINTMSCIIDNQKYEYLQTHPEEAPREASTKQGGLQ